MRSQHQRRSWVHRLLRAVFIFCLVPYLALLVLITAFQRSLIYQPSRTAPLAAAKEFPAGNVEDVTLHTSNDLPLHGWRYRAQSSDSVKDGLLILYFPGNAGCRADRMGDCREFAELGCDVILFDYRGYGDNEGSPSEAALAEDARRAWTLAVTQWKFPHDRIVLFGESLGGAVATRLASELCADGTPPAALVLNSTFASLSETAAWHFPAIPVPFLLLDRFPSAERIAQVTCPVLHFHGTADEVVPFQHGEHLFAAAPEVSTGGIRKKFVAIPEGRHNFISATEMKTELLSLFEKIRPPSEADASSSEVEPLVD